jgi:hypothetical protein
MRIDVARNRDTQGIIQDRLCIVSSRWSGTRLAGDTHMNDPIGRAVAIAIESYVHAPRTLSVLEVVQQVAAVFPAQDHAQIARGVRESRRMGAADR